MAEAGRRGLRIAAALLVASLAGAQDAPPPRERTESPREIGLAERARAQLAQLDFTVIGPPEAIGRLEPEDFTIRINFRRVREFELDRYCAAPAAAAADAEHGGPSGAVGGPRASYLFYFDQPFLTMTGRMRSLEVARTLVDRLIEGGTRGMLVSNATRTVVIQPLTEDRELLQRKLDELEGDRSQWDMYAQLEDDRVRDVVETLNWSSGTRGGDVNLAIARARVYQKEERWHAERHLRRLAVTVGQLVDLEPPKALIYFGDTLRANPGEHYLSFFGQGMRETEPALSAMTSDALTGALAFDRVINEASAQGIRIYAVEAQGLSTSMDRELPNPYALDSTSAVPSSSRVRLDDTHRALDSLAAETGGRSFLHGIRASKIAERILADSSCVYLASFDPEGFAQDDPLRVTVGVSRPGVELRTRGRIVLQSESARKTSQLLRAFSAPDSIPDPFEIRAGMIPTGFSNGSYSALLQISVPGSPLQGATWDLGGTLYSDQKVRAKASGRLSASGPNVPVIFEQEVSFKAGAHEVVAVAHEAGSGLVASTHIDFEWPRLRGADPGVGPIVAMQPASGAFLREGSTRSVGSLLVPERDPLWTALPAAFVGLVCRGRSREALRVERRIVGETTHEFPDLGLEPGDQPCAQLRDVVPSNSLRAGAYRYEVRLVDGEGQVGAGAREFVALAPGTSSPSD